MGRGARSCRDPRSGTVMTRVGLHAPSDHAALRGHSVLSCRPYGVRRKSSLSKRANLPCHLTQPQCKGISIVGRDTKPSYWATIVSSCAVESVCRKFDIETYEVAGTRSIVDIDVKAAGIVHVTMLRLRLTTGHDLRPHLSHFAAITETGRRQVREQEPSSRHQPRSPRLRRPASDHKHWA